MSVRPTLLKDLRRTAVQQHQESTGTGSYNRWDVLNPRQRTFSYGKRQLDKQGPSDGNAPKTPRLDSNTVFSQLKDQDNILSEVESTLEEMEKISTETPPDPRFACLTKIVKLLANSHKNLTSAVVDSVSLSASGSKVTTAANNKAGNTGSKNGAGVIAPAPVTEEENLTKKVKSTLREAEKKTVLFNLNLGKNPVMNKETISRKVTETLCAAVKSGKHDYDIKDAEEVLDDILSCSKLEFLGSSTKRFTNDNNPNDTRNGMHTIPVRMDFKDRDTRFEAEIML
jgi:hypothetical protein